MKTQQSSLQVTLILGIAAMAVSRIVGLPEFAFAVSVGVMLIAASVGTVWSFLQVEDARRSLGLAAGIVLCCSVPWIMQTIAFPGIVGFASIAMVWLIATVLAVGSYVTCAAVSNLLPSRGASRA